MTAMLIEPGDVLADVLDQDREACEIAAQDRVGCSECPNLVEVDPDSGLCATCLWGAVLDELPADGPQPMVVVDLNTGLPLGPDRGLVLCDECGEPYPNVCPDLCGSLGGSIPPAVRVARAARRKPFPIGPDGRVIK